MTTENNFTATAETFKENLTKGMKWMQDANAKLVETQKQQMKTVTDMFNKTTSAAQFGGANKLNNPFADSGKAMIDMFQKNMETVTNFLKVTMKPVTELTKYSDKDIFAKEMKKQLDTLTEQASDLVILNQTNLDLVLKQLNTTSTSFSPVTEQFKKEIEKAVTSSKETIQTIMDSYSEFSAPSIEANKETFEKFNEQIKTSINANVKFWSDLMNSATTATTNAANAASKAENPILKITSSVNNKKQTANMN